MSSGAYGMRAVAWVGGHSVQCHETGVVAKTHSGVPECVFWNMFVVVCFLGVVWVGSLLCSTVVVLCGVFGSCPVVGRLDRV